MRARRLMLPLVALASGLACTPAVAPLEPPPGARSLLLIAIGPDALEISASDLDGAFLSRLPPADELALTALFYDRPLAGLGLDSGVQALAGDDGRPLPTGWIAGRAATLSDRAVAAWTPTCATPADCAAVVDPRARLPRFDPRACANTTGCAIDGSGCLTPCPAPAIAPPAIDDTPVASPTFTPCPAGWTSRTSTRTGLTACLPASATCTSPIEAPFADGCADPCTHATPPADAIRADARGLDVAIAAAPAGGTVLVDAGRWAAPARLDRGVTLLGACPDHTVITGALRVDDGALTDLTIDGEVQLANRARLTGVRASAPITAARGAQLQLDTVVADAAITLDAATLDATRLLARGPLSASGGMLTLHRARLDTGTSTAVTASAAPTTIVIEASALHSPITIGRGALTLRDVRAEASGVVASSTAAVALERVWLARPLRSGLALTHGGADAQLTDVVVEDAGLDEGAIRARDGAPISAQRVHVQGGRGRGVALHGERNASPAPSQLADVRVLDVGDSGPDRLRLPFDCAVCLDAVRGAQLDHVEARRVSGHALRTDNVVDVLVRRFAASDITQQTALFDRGGVGPAAGPCIRLANSALTLEQIDVIRCVGGLELDTSPGGAGDVHLHDVRVGPNVFDGLSAIVIKAATAELARVEITHTVLGHGIEISETADVTVRDLTARGMRRLPLVAQGERAGTNASVYLRGISPVVLERFELSGATFGIATGDSREEDPAKRLVHRFTSGVAAGDEASLCVADELDAAQWAAQLSGVATPSGIRQPACAVLPYKAPDR